MQSHFLDRITPRAFPRTRLLSAAVVWSAVGFFLVAKGVYLFQGELRGIALTVAIGVILGLIKSRYVLDRVAKKNILRIGARPARACLGGLFSLRNWLLIALMIVFGRVLGALPIDTALKTGLYVTVGTGLAYSSRLLWNALKTSPDHLP